jgi:hypothetical protein
MAALEQSLVWPPVEAVTQTVRNAQKTIAKDVTGIMAQAKAITAAVPKEAADSAAPLTADQLPMKAKVALTKAVQGMIKEVQALKRKLEDSDRVAAKNGRLCVQRLSYLKQVESLADENRSGTAEYERMDDEERLSTLPLATVRPAAAAAAASSSTPSRNNAASSSSAMEVDDENEAKAASASSSAPMSEEFVVTPQLRMDRIFVDHLLRTSKCIARQ